MQFVRNPSDQIRDNCVFDSNVTDKTDLHWAKDSSSKIEIPIHQIALTSLAIWSIGPDKSSSCGMVLKFMPSMENILELCEKLKELEDTGRRIFWSFVGNDLTISLTVDPLVSYSLPE
jgi:hypothetical protein